MARTPKMTAAHFQFIADAIAALPDRETRVALAHYFAGKLPATNPNFDRERFVRACVEDR